MARRQAATGYRPLIVAYLDAERARWNETARERGHQTLRERSEIAVAIEAGEPVTVPAEIMFLALRAAGHSDAALFAWDGPHFRTPWPV